MADYEKMYRIMFNAATDAERLTAEAVEILRKAQQECEKLYIESADDEMDLMSGTKAVGE